MEKNDEQVGPHSVKEKSDEEVLSKDSNSDLFTKALEKTIETSEEYSEALTNFSKQIKSLDDTFTKCSSTLGLENTDSNLKDIQEAVLLAQTKVSRIQKILNSINNSDKQDRSKLENSNLLEQIKNFEFYPVYIDYKKYIPKNNSYLPIQSALKNELSSSIVTNLYNQTQETMQQEKLDTYKTKKEKIEKERVGILGLFTKKNHIKDAKLKNINLQIKLAEREIPPLPEDYGMSDILCDIKLYKEEQNLASLSPKMQKFHDGIHNLGNKKIVEDAKIKFENLHCNLAVPYESTSFWNKGQKELEQLQKMHKQLYSKFIQKPNNTLSFSPNFESAHDSLLSNLTDLDSMLSNKLHSLELVKTNYISNEKNENEQELLEI